MQDPVNDVADYFVTGVWSEKAAQEVDKMACGKAHVVFSTKSTNHDGGFPPESEWRWSNDGQHRKPSYIYYCDNETVHGVEWSMVPTDSATCPYSDVPVVCDMSSNILSRPVDVRKFGLIFAGAQKNIGPAGVTLVIVRRDLLERKKVISWVRVTSFDPH